MSECTLRPATSAGYMALSLTVVQPYGCNDNSLDCFLEKLRIL